LQHINSKQIDNVFHRNMRILGAIARELGFVLAAYIMVFI